MTAGGPRIERLFVCIGAQKAGTTWLARMLAAHPDLFLTPVKEIHYFDHRQGLSAQLSDAKRRSRHRKFRLKLWTQWHRRRVLAAQRDWYAAYMRDPIDDDWYASLFRERGACRVAGEATPEYALIGQAGFRHLQRLAPDARLLYILRHPVDRAWSQLLHLCRRLRLDASRAPDDRLIAMADDPAFAAHGDYPRTLDDVASVFPPGQVRVAFYEDIHADRAAALRDICQFIGLRYDGAWFPSLARRYNISQEAAMPAGVRAHLGAKYAPLVQEVERRVGRVPESWERIAGDA